MSRLIGRDEYLDEMERRFSNPGIRTLAIYGRRRVGKTAIIREFCKGKRHLFLTANEESLAITLQSFNYELNRFLGTETEPPSDFAGFLRRLREADSEDGRTVIVIDEYPFIANRCTGADSMLQRFIDHDLQDMNAFLIVCGSSMGAMEESLYDREGALYKRFIGPLKIRPLPYYMCAEFHPGMDPADLIRIYSIAGGFPLYHILMAGRTAEECIKNSLLGPLAPLASEAEETIRRELPSPESSLAVIEAVASGRNTINEIMGYTNQSRPWCASILAKLEMLDIIAEKKPMCGADRKTRRFVVRDGLVRFYREILAKRNGVALSEDRDAAYGILKNDIESFYGHMFESICMQYVMKAHLCSEIGSWWGNAGGTDTDIDIVAVIEDGGKTGHLAVECKFRNKRAGERELEELIRTSGWMKGAHNLEYCIISRNGFTEDLADIAAERGIELVDPEAMYLIKKSRR